jgi:hypothetical protein
MDVDSDMFSFSFRFKVPDSYPSREDVLAVIATVRMAAPDYVDRVVLKSLSGKAFSVPPLFKMQYLLRHSTVHLSYMRAALSGLGYRIPDFSKRFRLSHDAWHAPLASI